MSLFQNECFLIFFIFIKITSFYITDLVLRAARENGRRREREIMILFILSHPALGEWGVEGSELAQG